MLPRSVVVIATLSLCGFSSASFATDEWRKDAWMLPKYCQDRVDWSNPASPWHKWHGYFGNVAIHMSHYCNGVHGELMAKQTVDNVKRNLYVAKAADEMAYVSPNCDQKCVVYAELHRRWAWALMQQGKFTEAMKHTRLAESSPQAPIPVVPPMQAK